MTAFTKLGLDMVTMRNLVEDVFLDIEAVKEYCRGLEAENNELRKKLKQTKRGRP